MSRLPSAALVETKNAQSIFFKVKDKFIIAINIEF